MNQEESKARRREELVRAYLNDTISKTFQGISELSEEAAETVLKEACKACTKSWLGFLAHYGYDSEKPDVDAFLAADEKIGKQRAQEKASLTRQGNVVMERIWAGECQCPLIKTYKLVKPFPNFCLCAEHGLKAVWEAALKRPVNVDIIESYNRGGNSCTIKIELL